MILPKPAIGTKAYDIYDATVRTELDGLEWFRDRLAQRDADLAALQFDVGRMILGMRSS